MEEEAPKPIRKAKPTGHYISRWKRAKEVFYRLSGITTKENKTLTQAELKPGQGISTALQHVQTLVDQKVDASLSRKRQIAWAEDRLKALTAAFDEYEEAVAAYRVMLAKSKTLKPPGGITASAYAAAIKTLEMELKAYHADLERDIAAIGQHTQHLRESGKKAGAVQQQLSVILKRVAAVIAATAATAHRVRSDRSLPFEVYDGQVKEMAMQIHGGLQQANRQLEPFHMAIPSWMVAGAERWLSGTPGQQRLAGMKLEERLMVLDEFDELVHALEQWLEEAKAAAKKN